MDWWINPRDWAVPIAVRVSWTHKRGWEPDYGGIVLQILCLTIEWSWLLKEID